MKCFSHNNQDAVAVCKICLKGVCSGCAQNFPTGVSCPGPCADEMAKQVAMTDVASLVTSGNKVIGGVLAPLAFSGCAVWIVFDTVQSDRRLDGLTIVLAGVMLAVGLWLGGVSLFSTLRQRAASNYSLKRTNQSLRD